MISMEPHEVTAHDALFITNTTSPYYQYPYSLSRLPAVYEKGLYGPGICGLLSAISCLICLVLIASKLIKWKKGMTDFFTYNQYLILLANLLCAEMIQGAAYAISLYWIHVRAIHAPTHTCFAQGLLVNLGDVSSAFFILLIAAHTFYVSVSARRISAGAFCTYISVFWLLAWILSLMAPAIRGPRVFVPSTGWCWISMDYMTDRLAYRFFWMFLVQFGTLCIYTAVLIRIKSTMRKVKSASGLPSTSPSRARLNMVAKSMVVYPASYIILTLPLLGMRMWNVSHLDNQVPDAALLVGVTLLASCGWVDAALYTYSRRHLISNNSGSNGSGSSGARSRIMSILPAVMTRSRPTTQFTASENTGTTRTMSTSIRDVSGKLGKQSVILHVDELKSNRTSSGPFQAIEEGLEGEELDAGAVPERNDSSAHAPGKPDHV